MIFSLLSAVHLNDFFSQHFSSKSNNIHKVLLVNTLNDVVLGEVVSWSPLEWKDEHFCFSFNKWALPNLFILTRKTYQGALFYLTTFLVCICIVSEISGCAMVHLSGKAQCSLDDWEHHSILNYKVFFFNQPLFKWSYS